MTDAFDMCDVLANSGPYQCEADANYDGTLDLLDLAPFRNILLDVQTEDFLNMTSPGPGDFFWSTQPLGEGAINQDLNLNLEVGESVVLYLYYSTNGPNGSDINDGIAINVATTSDGIIAITDAGMLNFRIVLAGTDISLADRWGFPVGGVYAEYPFFGSAQNVQDNLVVGMTATSFCIPTGILESNSDGSTDPFMDSGYDPAADAFLIGKVLLDAQSAGTVGLIAGPNDLGISNNGQLLEPTFAGVEINVGSTVLLGDVNQDGAVNLLDVENFVDRIATGVFQEEADCNQDDEVNLLDVNPFIQILAGG